MDSLILSINLTPETIKGILFAFGIGAMLIWKSIQNRKKIRKISDTPRSKIESAPQGYVEVQGFAWPMEETARGSCGEELIYYSLAIQKKVTKGSGKSRRTEWETKFSREHCRNFYVVDPTGLAMVYPGDGEFDVGGKRTRSWSSLNAEEKKAVVSALGGRRVEGFPPSNFLFGIFSGQYRIVERKLEVGSPLYVHGDFRTIADSSADPKVEPYGLSEFASRVFNREARTLKNINHFLDKNKDGTVSAEESKRGYIFAAKQARTKALSALQQRQQVERPFTVYGKFGSSQSHRLLVADLHEEHLIDRKGRFLNLQFVAGVLLIAFASAILVPKLFLPSRVPAAQSGSNFEAPIHEPDLSIGE